MRENNNTQNLVIGTLLGGAIGTATALLLAPKSGSELRQDICDKYEDMSDAMSEPSKWLSSEPEPDNTPWIWGGVAGGLLAAAAAVLYTTKAGSDIRQEISDRYEDLSDSKKSQLKSLVTGLKSGRSRKHARKR